MAAFTERDPLFNTLLNQGKSFLNIQNDYKYMVDPHLKLIEQTTSPKLGSLIENFSQKSPSNIIDKFNLVAANFDVSNDGANTDAMNTFNSIINNYNAAYKAYGAARAAWRGGDVGSLDKAATQRNNMIDYMIQLNSMIKQKLVGRTTTGPKPQYDYQSGSGEAGAGDQPQLMAMRAKILGPLQTNLSKQRSVYDNHVKGLNTLIGEGDDTTIRSKAAYYKYIVWTIVSITILSHTIKYATS